jgi:hypothetical protein
VMAYHGGKGGGARKGGAVHPFLGAEGRRATVEEVARVWWGRWLCYNYLLGLMATSRPDGSAC